MNKFKKFLKENVVTKDLYKGLSYIYNYRYRLMSDRKFAEKKYKQTMGKHLMKKYGG